MEQDIPGAEREIKRALDARQLQLRRAAAVHPDCRPSGLPRPSPGPDAPAPEGPPNEGFAYIAEADIELRRQHPDLAIGLLKKAVATTDPQDALVRLFSMLISMKKRDEALAFETQWLNAHPTDYAFAGGVVADVLLAQGDFEAALSRYENFLKRNPDSLPSSTTSPGQGQEPANRRSSLWLSADSNSPSYAHARHLCHRAGRRQAVRQGHQPANAS